MANTRPMRVEVTTRGTYHMRDVVTPRNVELMAILKDEGGINMSTPPGMYLFNVLPGPLGLIVSLEPA